MSNFSFAYTIFTRFVLQTHKNKGLFGKGFTWPFLGVQLFLKTRLLSALNKICVIVIFFWKFCKASVTTGLSKGEIIKQEGHDGPVSLHWLIREIHSYQTLHYLGIGLKHKTPYKD